MSKHQEKVDRSIYVTNLAFDVNEKELYDVLKKSGRIEFLHLFYDQKYERPAGRGLVLFSTKEEAHRAIDNCNGIQIKGRPIKVTLNTKDNSLFHQVNKANASNQPVDSSSRRNDPPRYATTKCSKPYRYNDYDDYDDYPNRRPIRDHDFVESPPSRRNYNDDYRCGPIRENSDRRQRITRNYNDHDYDYDKPRRPFYGDDDRSRRRYERDDDYDRPRRSYYRNDDRSRNRFDDRFDRDNDNRSRNRFDRDDDGSRKQFDERLVKSRDRDYDDYDRDNHRIDNEKDTRNADYSRPINQDLRTMSPICPPLPNFPPLPPLPGIIPTLPEYQMPNYSPYSAMVAAQYHLHCMGQRTDELYNTSQEITPDIWKKVIEQQVQYLHEKACNSLRDPLLVRDQIALRFPPEQRATAMSIYNDMINSK